MDPGAISATPKTPAEIDFAAAEKLFGSGDVKGAFPLYQKALAEDPTSYLAALYAGDSLFKLGDCPQAGAYYAKAIAIDPNRETAYRYYGDCLTKLREMAKAKDMYIQAVLAQPYQKTPRQSLNTWAEANHARIMPPPVSLPNRAAPGKDGNISITLDANAPTSESSLALMYSMNSALWQGEKFKKAYPNEKKYRHSLAEEKDSIHGMLQVARETKIPDRKLEHVNQSVDGHRKRQHARVLHPPRRPRPGHRAGLRRLSQRPPRPDGAIHRQVRHPPHVVLATPPPYAILSIPTRFSGLRMDARAFRTLSNEHAERLVSAISLNLFYRCFEPPLDRTQHNLVISTEGGVFCRRSRETCFSFAVARVWADRSTDALCALERFSS